MDQTLPYYFLFTIFMVLVIYGAGDIQCEHSCLSNKTCNYMEIQDTCYYVFKDKLRNWFDSRQFCVEQELSMVKVTKDMIERNQTYDFRGLFNDIPKELTDLAGRPLVWLGGRVFDLSDWTFLNNTKALTGSGSSSIQNFNLVADCGFTKMEKNNNLQIDVGGCSNSYPFICRFNNTLIQRIDLMMPWFDARSHCIKLGGDLFYLYQHERLNVFENDTILTYIIEPHHIGLRHRVWEWIDGSEIVFTNWEIGEPNKYLEKCLQLYGDSGKWNDNDCYEDKVTFCQGAPPAVTPPVYSATIPNCLTEKPDTDDQLRVLVIILGLLLGVSLIISISLILSIVYTRYARKSTKPSTSDASGYEIPVVHHYENEGVSETNKYETIAT